MDRKPTFGQLLVSVLGAFFGVQSSKTRQRDFEHGADWRVYAGLALVCTILLVLGVLKWVQFTLSHPT